MKRRENNFYSRVYTSKFINEVVNFRINNPRWVTIKKFDIKGSTIDKWLTAYKEGRVFKDRPKKYSRKKTRSKSNAKFSYEIRKAVIKHYKRFGFASTIKKFEIGETTLIRWKKLDEEGKLKPISFVRNMPEKIPNLSESRKSLIERNKILNIETFNNMFSHLTRLGKYRVIDSLRNSKLSIQSICDIANINKRSYYKWVENGRREGIPLNKDLANYIGSLKQNNNDHLGYRSIKFRYQDEFGEVVSINQIKRVANIIGYESVAKRKLHSNKNRRNIQINRKNVFRHENETINHTYKYLLKKDSNLVANESNFIWSADATTIFSHADKRTTLKMISIIDNHDRAILSFRFTNGSNHTKVFLGMLNSALKKHGSPFVLHMDNGFEFVNNELKKFSTKHKIKLSYSAPATPEQNGLIESWHRTLKKEVNIKKLGSLEEAKISITKWIHFYNNRRRHSGLLYSRDEKEASSIGEKTKSEQAPITARKISLKNKK